MRNAPLPDIRRTTDRHRSIAAAAFWYAASSCLFPMLIGLRAGASA